MTDHKVDGQEWRINMMNGLFNPKTQLMEPHTPNYFSTVQVPFSYDPEAQAPLFKAFIEKISGGDKEIAQMLQEVFGYCLLDGNPKHKVFYFYGNTARNGKSTTAKILSGLLGQGNVSALSLGQLGNDNSSILMSLMGKQLNFSDEISTKYIESPRLISLSSEGVIEVNPKYKDTFTCRIKAKFIIACNDMPRFHDAQGMNHRLHIIPFNVQIPADERIDRYDEELLTKEGPGILNWAIQGLQLFLLNGKLTVAKQSEEEAEYTRLESDPVRAFLEEYFVFDPSFEDKIFIEDLYGDERTKDEQPTMFRGYCARSGIKTPSIHTMARQLRRYADETKKIQQKKMETGRRHYVGLRSNIINTITQQLSPYGTNNIPF
jgi:putative DNA primase/helicase